MQENENKVIHQKIDDIIAARKDFVDRNLCISLLSKYVKLLQHWLQTHNVVSRKNNNDDIWENIFDSLVVSECEKNNSLKEFFREKNIVDAGAGGGFPGLPLAILYPEKEFLLVDVSRKKCSFLRLVKAQLNLKNVSVMHSKIEEIEAVNFIVTKAAFSPPNIGLLAGVLKNGGHLLLWAAINDQKALAEELKKHRVNFIENYAYSLGIHAQRSLLLFAKEG